MTWDPNIERNAYSQEPLKNSKNCKRTDSAVKIKIVAPKLVAVKKKKPDKPEVQSKDSCLR